jgi:hypothetical protein
MRVGVFSVSKRFYPQRCLRPNHRAALALLSFILIPPIALFCWQWNAPTSLGNKGSDTLAKDNIFTASTVISRTGSWLSDFLNGSHLTPLSGTILPDSGNTFRNLSSREMIAANGDPFIYAYLSGESEGALVVKEVSGGIITLGIPGMNGAATPASAIDALQLLQAEVGGSFAAFHARLFGPSAYSSTTATGSAQKAENPFSNALSSLTEESSASTASQTDAKSGTEENKQEEKQDSAASESGTDSASGLINRPYLMLKVDESGNLQAMPASQPYKGAFETAELGTVNYSVLPFGDTADFEANIAVADFNGDGISDVAYLNPYQGLLRFFYGSADGEFSEELNVTAGRTPCSIVTGDFNNDGQVDIALSANGGGLVKVFFGDGPYSYRYKTYYFKDYWDYTAAADTTGSGSLDLVGLNYSDNAVVLMSFGQTGTSNSGKVFNYTPALNSSISTANGNSIDVRAMLLSSSLSLSTNDSMSQLRNVLNVAADSKVSIVIGDLFGDGRTVIGIAIPHP